MRFKLITSLCLTAGCLAVRQANAAIAWSDPVGGWTYQFDCNVLNTTNPAAGSAAGCTCGVSFDGTWHFTGGGSDQWGGDGLCPPFTTNTTFGTANSPGGWSIFSEADPVHGGPVTFARMQDTGDPRQSGFRDQPSNHKLMMGRQMDILDAASQTQLADGFAMCFRARVPTATESTNCIDPLYPASTALGAPGPKPYPAGGDGYVTFNGGKGNFMVHDGDPGNIRGASIAFSLTQTNDNNGSSTAVTGFRGLTMNELAGNTINDNVDFGQGTGTNLLALDPTKWHEFWIVIKRDPSGLGTHLVYIFLDGSVVPKVIHLTAGASAGQADFGNTSTYICIASPSTGQSCALDIDFIAYKLGTVYPPGAVDNLPPTIINPAPALGATFYTAASGLHLIADTAGTNKIPTSGATLVLNGVDVSSSLVASGTAADRTFTYSSLVANTYYQGRMIVSDQAGRTATNDFNFDTFVEASTKLIEIEDYNYSGGQYINDPVPAAYAGKTGTYLTDFEDSSLATTGDYRTADAVDIVATTDFARPRFTSSGVIDYDVGSIVYAEWLNYTRDYTAGSYNAYLRASATVAQDIRVDLVTAGSTGPSQTLKYLGTFHVPRTGSLFTYTDVPLRDMAGNLLALPLSGTMTLRLTAVSAANDIHLNFLALLSASAPSAPVVSTSPSPGATGLLPNVAVEAAIADGSSPVTVGSVVMTVNGSAVSATATKVGGVTLVKYTPAGLWPLLSSNYVSLAFNDGTARNVSWSFTVAYLPTLTSAMQASGTSTPGFVFRVFQNNSDNGPSTDRAERQLAGIELDGLGNPVTNRADPNVTGPADGTGVPDPTNPDTKPLTYTISNGGINMSQQNGYYGNIAPDDAMPGVPGVAGQPDAGKDGVGADVRTFVTLPAGLNIMTVDSDDGFKLTAGFTNAPLVLSDQEGLFGGTVIIPFIVQQAGTYPFRIVYFQSDHGYGLEWTIVKADGSFVLVNDTVNGGPAAFQVGTAPTAPHPTLTITRAPGGQVMITWGNTGTLQVANSVTGPYTDILSAVSPYTTTASGTKFYRVRVP